MNRRSFLTGMGALAACAHAPSRPVAPAFDPLDVARGAARYLRSQRVETEHGLAWKKSPDEPGDLLTDLYHGAPGIAVFLLELHRAIGDGLDEAVKTMAHVVATWPAEPHDFQLGLHGGFAGHAFVADAIARETKDPKHVQWVGDAIARLDAAIPAGEARTPRINDVLYGSAGMILALLALDHERALGLATGLGNGLLTRAERTGTHAHWKMKPADTDELPNFSHGTAGISYALARLYEVTHEQRFLDSAIAGAEFLLANAMTQGNVCLVPHWLPGGTGRYYLAYCHGPAGTARLFHQLHQLTRDEKWARTFDASINGVLYANLPEERTPGYWDNVGQCCGTAAIGELALTLHRMRGDAWYRAWADRLAADIIARASRHDGAYEWIHAENRAEPFWKQSYTGYMQGAAGIGSLFIRLAGHDAKKPWKVRFPDNPWPV